MGRMLTLIVDIFGKPQIPQLPPGYTLRPSRLSDIAELGHLYFESYDPGVACSNLADAIADIEAAFAGAYGELWCEASLVTVTQGKQLVAAIQVVRRAPWDDTPACPFVIELFVARSHRRRGVARALLCGAMDILTAAQHDHLALGVDEDNNPALSLYESLGFHEWTTRPLGCQAAEK